MSELERYFNENEGNLIHKWVHYFDIYERHFSRFRGTAPCVLEFGVSHGGSLQMWKHYFGPGAKLYGVDINERCKVLEEPQVEIIIGDQSDVGFLRSLKEKIPRLDILIDDGGHRMEHQIYTFEVLFPHIDPYGVYLCEDVCTSYWRKWGGGYKRQGTFIEYSKNFVDYLNAWHSKQTRKLPVSDFTRSVDSVTYYDNVVVIEKRPKEKPYTLKTGNPRLPAERDTRNALRRSYDRYIGWRFDR